MNYTECDSPLGIVRAFFDGDTLTGLYFVGQKYDRGLLSGDARMIDAATPARALRQWLSDYFEGDARPYPGKLAMRGTAFQQAVWQTLRGIGHGHTRSYGEIAEQMGHAMAVRAVGAAVGRNPVSIIVPCHRVLGSTGSLTGYAGGVDRKAALLTLESATFGRR